MSLEGLRPTIASIEFDGSTKYEGARLVRSTDIVVRDIQAIHDSSLTPIELKRMRLHVPPNTLELAANPHGVAQAMFHANVAVMDLDKVHVWLPNPAQPGQKAGMAALHLYGQLTEGRSLVEQITIQEESTETADRFVQQVTEGFSMLEIENLMNEATAPPADGSLEASFIVSSAMTGSQQTGSLITWSNDTRLALPEALRQVQAGYDSLYPELGSAATSVAVAGIVSAPSLAVFEDAWESSIRYYDRTRPWDASRALLESGTFHFGVDGV